MTPTTPHLRIAERPATRPDIAEQLTPPLAAAERTPPALGQPGPTLMSPLLTARLSAWRELRSRWMVLLLLPALFPLRLVLSDANATAWSFFLAVLIAPVVCVMAAAGGRSEADAFWRGLGGPTWARLLGQQLMHLVFVGGPIAAVVFSLVGWPPVLQDRVYGVSSDLLQGMLLAYPVLYTTAAAARARVSGLAVIAGPLAGLAVIGVSMFISEIWIRDWSPLFSAVMRTGLVSLAALVAVYRWERIAGTWGAAVQRRGWLPPVAGLAGLLALSIGGELAWSRAVMPPGYIAYNAAEDGSIAVFVNDLRLSQAPDRVWVWSESRGYYRLPGLQNEVMAGPGEALLTVTSAGEVTLTQGGTSLSCPKPEGSYLRGESWRSDGRQVVGKWSTLAAGRGWSIDLDAGTCGQTVAGELVGDRLLSVQDGVVRWGDQVQPLPTGEPADVGFIERSRNARSIRHGGEQHRYIITTHDSALAVEGPFLSIERWRSEVPDGERMLSSSLRLTLDTMRVDDLTDGTTWDLAPHTRSHAPSVWRDGDALVLVTDREVVVVEASFSAAAHFE